MTLSFADARQLAEARGGLEVAQAESDMEPSARRAFGYFRATVCTCSVQIGGHTFGSGVLIGPDLVLTNYHVVQQLDENPALLREAKVHFGFFDDSSKTMEREVIAGLMGPPIARSKVAPGDRGGQSDRASFVDQQGYALLDYAVLRVVERVADRTVEWADQPPYMLGWVRFGRDPRKLQADDKISVLQYPQRDLRRIGQAMQKPQQSAPGVIRSSVADGLRLVHSASTAPGSSGGAMLDKDFVLVGLHNSGFPENYDATGKLIPARNRGIPLNAIVEDLEEHHPDLLEEIMNATLKPIPNTSVPVVSVITQAAERHKNEELKRRVDNALLLLDRDVPSGRIRGLFTNRLEQRRAQVHHLYAREPDDAVRDFIARLVKADLGAADGLLPEAVYQSLLSGRSEACPPWSAGTGVGLVWPAAEADRSEVEADFRDAAARLMGSQRTLVSFVVRDLNRRSAEEERFFIAALAQALADAAPDDAQPPPNRRLQVLVVHLDTSADGRHRASFGKMWPREGSPRNCGISMPLDALRRDHLEQWAMDLRTFWGSERQVAFTEAIDKAFAEPSGEQSMQSLLDALRAPIEAFASANTPAL